MLSVRTIILCLSKFNFLPCGQASYVLCKVWKLYPEYRKKETKRLKNFKINQLGSCRSSVNPLSTKKYFVSNFFQNLYKHPPRCPITEHTFVFWNKSLLKSYRNFYIFGFLTVRNYPWFFFTAESLSLAEFESVGILEISWSVLKILAKQFSFF